MREIPYNHEEGHLPPSIERISFLSGFNESCLDEILKNTNIIECDVGDRIIHEGDHDKDLYILMRGKVNVLKDDEVVGELHTAGDLIGELALLSGEERTATVQASERTYCLKIAPEFLKSLSKVDRNAYYAVLYRFIADLLAERLNETSARLAELEKQLEQSNPVTDVYKL